MNIVPTTSEEWKHCITVSCRIPLTPEFVEQRIAALSNMQDHHTQRFVTRWGEAHRERTLGWFRQAADELV